MSFCRGIYLFLPLILLLLTGLKAEAQEDSLKAVPIDSSVVRTQRNTSGLLERSGGVSLSGTLAAQLPRLMGSSDMLRYAQYLPFVQSTSDIDSGIRIYGCENSHNFINIDGIPVYGCQHLLGLFSIFTPSHFEKISIMTRSPHESRLGGEIEMTSKTEVPSRPGGEINVGLMEAEGSFFTNLGDRTSMYVSARRSYLNLLYGKFLEIEDYPFTYNLTDVNFSLTSQLGTSDKLGARFYWGQDNVICRIEDYLLSVDDRWGNILGGIIWDHSFTSAKLSQELYATNYGNRLDLDYSQTGKNHNSSITDIGYSATLSFDSRLTAGVKFSYYRTSFAQNTFEADAWVSQEHDFTYWLSMSASARLEYFRADDRRNHFGFSPDLDFTFRLPGAGKIILGASVRHQYIFQTGITSLNMPLEFWFTAGRYSDPQRSINVDANYKFDFLAGRYSLNAGTYYNYLTGQVEYDSNLLDLIRAEDRFEDHLLHGKGFNFGANVMLRKNTGKFTGWVSYCFGRSLRQFEEKGASGYYPSSHERPHELKALGVYHLDNWDFSATFILASGLPFTPAKSFYLNSGQLICNYGEYNSVRLPAYIRLDLSVNCYFSKDHHNGLNLSLYNVTCNSNYATYRLFYNKDNDTFAYLPMGMRLYCLPSISYFHKF